MSLKCGSCDSTTELSILPCLHVSCSRCRGPGRVDGDAELDNDTSISPSKCKQCKKSGGDEESDASQGFSVKEKYDNGEIDASNTEKGPCQHEKCHYCKTCAFAFCAVCSFTNHIEHEYIDLVAQGKEKREFFTDMCTDLQKESVQCQLDLKRLKNLRQNFEANCKNVKEDICQKAEEIIKSVLLARDTLVGELNEIRKEGMKKYDKQHSVMEDRFRQITHGKSVAHFAALEVSNEDILSLHDSVASNLNKLVTETQQQLEMVNVKFLAPLKIREQHGKASLGSLITAKKGRESNLVYTGNSSIMCPTGVSVCMDGSISVCGTPGAYQEKGIFVLYTSYGREYLRKDLPAIPCDIKYINFDKLLVALTNGRIICFNSSGTEIMQASALFRGGGKMALAPRYFYVSSSEERCLYKYDYTFSKLGKIKTKDDFHPVNIALHPKGIMVVTGRNASFLIVREDNGGVETIAVLESDAPYLKSPSAICFDNFGNVLISDLATATISLFGIHSGRKSKEFMFLGQVLHVDSARPCLTAMTVDLNNNVFVCEFGGNIMCYMYLSCERKV